MKKSIRFLLSLLSVCSLTACSSVVTDDGDTTDSSPDVSTTIQQPSEPTLSLEYWFEHSHTKIAKTAAPTQSVTGVVHLAKNETENFQLVVRSDQSIDGVSITISPFTNDAGDSYEPTVFQIGYVKTEQEEIPDQLLPMGDSFSLTAGDAQPFFIQLTIPADASAGTYRATVVIAREKETLAEIPLTAEVWNFALPEAPSSITMFGNGYYNLIYDALNITDSDTQTEIKKDYYDFLLSHKISPYSLPYSVLDDRADAYMSDPRVTSFLLPYSTDEEILSVYQKISSNPVWAEKAYFYPIDEPTTDENLQSYLSIVERLSQLYPGFQIVTPFYSTTIYGEYEQKDMIDSLAPSQNIWCARSDLFTAKGKTSANYQDGKLSMSYYPTEEEKQVGTLLERLQQQKAEGDKLLWYVCCEPLEPYCNVQLTFSGLANRALFWQQKALGIDGILYWQTSYWRNNPEHSLTTAYAYIAEWTDHIFYGDGQLVYPGELLGFDGPIGSVRLENIRDGLDDFDYLTLAEQLLEPEQYQKLMNQVINGGVDIAYDSPNAMLNVLKLSANGTDNNLAETRIALGNAIEAALASQK